MKPLALNFLLAAAIVASSTAAELKRFRYQAELGGDRADDAPAVVTLTADLIRRTHDDFADLRVFDDTDREIPYVIYGQTVPGENRRQADLAPVKYEALADGGERITYQRPATLPGIDGLALTVSGGDFEKTIRVETSDDQTAWQPLATGQIFDYSSRLNLRHTSLDLPPTAARYLRLTISDDQPAAARPAAADDETVVLKYRDLEFRHRRPAHPAAAKPPRLVTAVTAWHGKTVLERQVTDRAPLTVSGQTINRDGDTVIDLGETNLPLISVSLDLGDKYFLRQIRVEAATGQTDAPWHPVASGAVYRFPAVNHPVGDRPHTRTDLQLDGRQHPRLRLLIRNRDNPPLTVNAVTGVYPRRNLYLWPAPARRYVILCDAAGLRAPRYDLPAILPEHSPALANAVPWTLSAPQPNPAAAGKYEPPIVSDAATVTPAQLWLFRGLMILLAAGLACWAWFALRKLQ
ncbi:MAG: DUF3999 domain-containing protein [Verrucomicrobiales bacterium]|jgi:hypothetical protein|nr:DUF3999 domain-containing protein [Verrucomicrobiales bacterium]